MIPDRGHCIPDMIVLVWGQPDPLHTSTDALVDFILHVAAIGGQLDVQAPFVPLRALPA